MLSIKFGEINYWAVLVSGIATFFLGAVWYVALFGNMRTELLGLTEEQIKQGEAAMPVTLSVLVLCYIVIAFVMAAMASGWGIESAAQGALLGFLLWLGFSAALGLTGHVNSLNPLGVFLIDAGYQLVFLVMTGAILGAWRK